MSDFGEVLGPQSQEAALASLLDDLRALNAARVARWKHLRPARELGWAAYLAAGGPADRVPPWLGEPPRLRIVAMTGPGAAPSTVPGPGVVFRLRGEWALPDRALGRVLAAQAAGDGEAAGFVRALAAALADGTGQVPESLGAHARAGVRRLLEGAIDQARAEGLALFEFKRLTGQWDTHVREHPAGLGVSSDGE